MNVGNRNKLFSVSLVGTVLATGLMAQGAIASIEIRHERAELAGAPASKAVVERAGPRGEVLLRQAYAPEKVVSQDGPQGQVILR